MFETDTYDDRMYHTTHIYELPSKFSFQSRFSAVVVKTILQLYPLTPICVHEKVSVLNDTATHASPKRTHAKLCSDARLVLYLSHRFDNEFNDASPFQMLVRDLAHTHAKSPSRSEKNIDLRIRPNAQYDAATSEPCVMTPNITFNAAR